MQFTRKSRIKIPRNRWGLQTLGSSSTIVGGDGISSSTIGGGGSSSSAVSATLWGNTFSTGSTLKGTIIQNEEISATYDWLLSAYYNSAFNAGITTEIGTDNAYRHIMWLGPKTSTYHPLELYYTNQSSGLLCDEVKAAEAYIDKITSKDTTKVIIDQTTDVTGTLTAYGSINQIESDEYDENPINSNSVIPLSTSKFWLGTSSFQWAKAFIEELHSYNITNTEKITTKDLLVTGSAHFFELVIDKIRSTNGAFILSQATGFEVDDVVYNGTKSVTLYHKATDNNGKEITQDWLVGDFAYCQTFNAATGTSYDVSNKYYWCLVTEVASTPVNRTINGVSTPCWWIKISQEIGDFDFLDADVGDNIAQLGHYKQDTETLAEAKLRGGALYLSAVQGIDTALKAPFIAQYEGIMAEVIDFELSNYRKTYIANGDSKFDGNFMVEGKTAKEYIDSVVPEASEGTPYIGANGNWFIYNQTTKQYEDSGVSAKGTNGENAGGFDLVINEVTIVDEALEWTTQGIIVDGTTRNPIDVNQYIIKIRKNEDANYSENYAAGSSGFYHDDNETKYDSSGNLVEKITFGLFEDATGTLLCTKEYYLTDSAESYQLLPIKNSIYTTYDIETKTQPIDCTLYYQLMHIKGHTRNLVSSGARILIQPYGGSTTHQLSYDSTLGYWYLVKDGSEEKGHLLDDNTSTGYNTYHIVVEAPIDGVTTTACRDSIDVVVVPQTMFKVMDGKIASYVSDELKNYSTIEQTSESIKAQVITPLSTTGIDIEAGKITLNAANTLINGALQVDSANDAEGITLLKDGAPKVILTNDSVNAQHGTVYESFRDDSQTKNTLSYYTDKIGVQPLEEGCVYKIYGGEPSVLYYEPNIAMVSTTTTSGKECSWSAYTDIYIGDSTTPIGRVAGTSNYFEVSGTTYKGQWLYLKSCIYIPSTYGVTASDFPWYNETKTWHVETWHNATQTYATVTIIGNDGILCQNNSTTGFSVYDSKVKASYNDEGLIVSRNGAFILDKTESATEVNCYSQLNTRRVKSSTSNAISLYNDLCVWEDDVWDSANKLEYLYDTLICTNSSKDTVLTLDYEVPIGYTLRIKALFKNLIIISEDNDQTFYKGADAATTKQLVCNKDTHEITYMGGNKWIDSVLA